MTNRNAPFWEHHNAALALGCQSCSVVETCGGLHNTSGIWDCSWYCDCKDETSCPIMCTRKHRQFVAWRREVGGFQLETIPSCAPVALGTLPSFSPTIHSRSGRQANFESDCVSVPLRVFFSKRNGRPLITSREELCTRFRFSPHAKLIVSGVGEDKYIERYWEKGRNSGVIAALHAIRPDLVTVPNFSSFADVPRWNELLNMKRIATCWYELQNSGLPCALHLNARTDRDYERWTEFVSARTEVGAVCFEFGTGAASPQRGLWHVERLKELAKTVMRPLTIVLKGGQPHVQSFRSVYGQVVHLSSEPFMRAIMRRRLVGSQSGSFYWRKVDESRIESLLQHNADLYRTLVHAASTN